MKNKTWLDKGTENIIERNPFFVNKTIFKNAHPQKMSEVLLDLAMPLLDEIDKSNKKDVEAIIEMAIMAGISDTIFMKSTVAMATQSVPVGCFCLSRKTMG